MATEQGHREQVADENGSACIMGLSKRRCFSILYRSRGWYFYHASAAGFAIMRGQPAEAIGLFPFLPYPLISAERGSGGILRKDKAQSCGFL
jgi:hypothetical protein